MTNPHPDPSAELANFREVISGIINRPYGAEPYSTIQTLEHNIKGLLTLASLLESQRDEARRKVERLPADWFEDSSLETWFPLTAETLKKQESELTSLKSTLAETDKENELLRGKLSSDSFDDSIVASCSCLTKTPDIQYHKPGCKYRIIVERNQALQALAETRAKLEETLLDTFVPNLDGEPTSETWRAWAKNIERIARQWLEEKEAAEAQNLSLTAALKTAREALVNAKGWIVANTTKPVHELIATIDAALSAIRGEEKGE
jgi:hypothetical protein